MRPLRKISIVLALIALTLLALDWLNVLKADRLFIIFPLLFLAIILKYTDRLMHHKKIK